METPATQAVPAVGLVQDEMMLRMWLHNRPHNTASAYRTDAVAFLRHVGKPLAQVTLEDLQNWDEAMRQRGHAPSSRARRLTVVRNLLKFVHGLGYIQSNPATMLKVQKADADVNEHIVIEADVRRMIAAETDDRRKSALRLLYVCGLRASELCGLSWKDMTLLKKGGEARILGKGNKPRVVIVPPDLWAALASLTPVAKPDSPVLPHRDGSRMNRKALHRIVKTAAKRVGLSKEISAHWLRHSHVSHSLDRGCPPHVVQQSVGHSSLATTTKYAHVRAGEGSASFIKG
jgi:site-specific recombinase XerD